MRRPLRRTARGAGLLLSAGVLVAASLTVPTAAHAVRAHTGSVTKARTHTDVAVNGTSAGRRFDGIGALSAGASSRLLVDYPKQQRDQILDYLFKPDYGAALHQLKIEIGGDTNSTDGTEPSHMRTPGDLSCNRGYEWWLAEQAKARNPHIELYALAWGTPGWVGEGKQTVWTDSYISYLLSWLGCAGQHHLHIDYLGGWNERGYDAAWYVTLRQALDDHGYGDIKLVADDSFNWDVDQAISTDPAFAKAVDIVGQHYVCGYLTAYESCPSPAQAQGFGKPLWASEQGSQPYDTGAAPLARAMNRQYVDGRMTATVNWSLVWSAYHGLPFEGDGLLNANEPWSGHYTVGPSVWATAQTTQFVRPGWRYLDSGSARIPGGSVVSLRDPSSSNWSSIVETLDATAAQRIRLDVSGGLSSATAQVWATNLRSGDSSSWFVRQSVLHARDGRYVLTAKPGYVYSVTTTRGQHKGTARPPAATGWRLPYHENFERYGTDDTARYLSDLGGTFATAPCGGGRAGTCLRQVVGTQPVQWNDIDNYPLTVVGDPLSWTNYRVGVDAMLEEAGTVDVGARVINGVSGYHLVVASGGDWKLQKVAADGTATVLAHGNADVGVGLWHRFTVTARQLEVSAAIDGHPVATVSDQTYTAGQVSLGGTAWKHAQFDDLSVAPTPGSASRLEVASVRPAEPYLATADDTTDVAATVRNPGPVAASDVLATLEVPSGWTATPRRSGSTTLAGGASTLWRWQLAAPHDAAPGRYTATMTVTYRSGGQRGRLDRVVPVSLEVVPHAGMTATADSAQSGYPATQAIDGDLSTLWHTQYDPYQPLPHAITLDLGKPYDVSGLQYEPRQDGNLNGTITDYTVSMSADGTHFTDVTNGTWADDPTRKSAGFPAVAARYVRLTAAAGHGGYASAAELDVVATPTHGPRSGTTDRHGGTS